jgi:hypothetical protein
MRIEKWISWAVAALMIVTASSARTDSLMFAGAGITSCATFAEQYRSYRSSPEVVELVYFAWAQGFMAGLNATDIKATGRARDISSITSDEQKGYLRSYCDAHPLSEYMYAVWDLYMKLEVAKPSP